MTLYSPDSTTVEVSEPKVSSRTAHRFSAQRPLSSAQILHQASCHSQSLNHIFQHSPIGMTVVDLSGRFLSANPSFCEALGHVESELIGRSFTEVTWPGDIPLLKALGEQLLKEERHYFQIETRHWTQSEQPLYVEVTVTLVRDSQEQPTCFLLQVINLTEQKWMAAKLQHDAFFDSLTGLANRALFVNRLEHVVLRLDRKHGHQCAVLFLDIDRFKLINYSLGHTVGDQLLSALGGRLASCLRGGDTLARLGGDEYAILLEAIDSSEDALKVCERIHSSLQLPFRLEGSEVFSSVSIGVVCSRVGYATAQDLLVKADMALYQAKTQGGACHRAFEPKLHQRTVSLWQMATQAQFAVERDELSVHYQPIVNLSTGRVTGVEALVRWHHPQHGLISPGDFIPVMEETGAITRMGQWVLNVACAQICQWQHQLPDNAPLRINVNISARQLRRNDLVQQVTSILTETGLSPENLQLEITETGMMSNSLDALNMLNALKALKVRLCLDDFGIGYSSLSRLQSLPIDSLKIDRSFVRNIDKTQETVSIIRSIIELGERLGMEIVAEGVETREQLEILRDLGCDNIQGFYFAKPMTAAAAFRYIQTSHHLKA
ncbi:MAG: putative bifunctional diguanylate cyclase/phosphodiesterase [Phormidesmis sp.]